MAFLRAAAAAALLACVAGASLRHSPFEAFVAKYGKRYVREERMLRAKIFAANLAKIEAHNALNLSWTKGVNKFADLTGDEWRAAVGLGRKPRTTARRASDHAEALEYLAPLIADPPASVDWTAKGGVTPVKDQGQCGSCWAFASVVAVEGGHFIASGSLASFSEQQIVSCDINNGDGNDGCNGGEQITALDWLAQQPGLCSEASYPYTSGTSGANGRCKKTCTPVVTVVKGVELPARNQTILEAAIAAQPLSLSVDASDDNIWQLYSGGIVTASCKCNSDNCLDHGVGGVGYGTDKGVDYWKIKNSWGDSWGEAGYIRLARGPAYGAGGQCGVMIDNAYAVTGVPA